MTVGWAASQNGVGNNGAQDLLCSYSSNGGARWTTVTIAHSDNTTRATIDGMNVLGYNAYDIARSGDIIYLLASISADNGSSLAVLYPSYLMLFTSTDNGATWKTPMRVNSPATDKQYYSTTYQDAHYSPKLAASGAPYTWFSIMSTIPFRGTAILYGCEHRGTREKRWIPPF